MLRNVTFDVVYNQSYNITYNSRRHGVEFRLAVDVRKATPRRRTINVTEYVNVTKEVTTTYNVTTHQPVDVVLALDASRSVIVLSAGFAIIGLPLPQAHLKLPRELLLPLLR